MEDCGRPLIRHQVYRGWASPIIQAMPCVFVFQAEEGIRDADVTGVQTCALPILTSRSPPDRGAINVHVADLAGGLRDVTQGTHVVSLSSVARNLTAVGVESDPTRPPDVVRFDLRKPQGLVRLTNVNDDVLANKRLARAEELWYSSSGGTRVQGWVVKPPSFDATKRYPLILEIHGGPFAMYNVGFSYMF